MTEVVAADGRRWSVRRRLRWPRWRQVGNNFDDSDLLWWAFPAEFSLFGIVFGVVLAAAIGLVLVLVLPLILFVAELLLVLGGVLLLRGTWIIEARTVGSPQATKAWKVRGLVQSKRAVEEVARELGSGLEAAPATGEPV